MLAHWIEIPATDFERAAKFYGAILDASEPIEDVAGGDVNFGFLPGERGLGAVCIVKGPGYEPTESGTIVFLSTGDDVAPILARVEAAGGAIIVPKTSIGNHGFRAIFRDTEGNRVGLHGPV
jgi:predicted enzyme related to lactoylglutathione lyase